MKRFYPFAWIFSSTFRWNCISTQIGKTYNSFSLISRLSLIICPLICSFLTLQYTLFGFQWAYLLLLAQFASPSISVSSEPLHRMLSFNLRLTYPELGCGNLPLVGSSGLEPPTSRLSGARSNHLSYEPIQFFRCISFLLLSPYCFLLSLFRQALLPDSPAGGDDGIRTHDPLLAGQVLSQLSYTPILWGSFLPSSLSVTQNWTTSYIYKASALLSLRHRSFGFFHYFWIQDILVSDTISLVLHRKEVIQPHLPIRLPCYDLTPIIEPTFGSVLLAVRLLTSGIPNFHGLTGGVYKAREHIHRGMLIRDY